MQQLLASNDLHSPTPDTILKLFVEDQSLSNLFPNLSCLLRMYFTLPCTTCEAEHTFSAFYQIKNYLRSTMSQCKLNSCCVLHIHSDIADELNVENLMSVWINRAAVCINKF